MSPGALTMTEEDLLEGVISLARVLGWRTAHFRPARTQSGWRTAVAGDGKGWPDLVAVRAHRILFAELKSSRGRLSVEQSDWLEALLNITDECYIWTPKDWRSGQIESILRTERAP